MMIRGIVLLLAAASLPAHAEDCRSVDSSRGSVSFEVEQAGSPFQGQFRRFGGEVCLSGMRATRVDVWLDPASVDAGLPEIDAALKGGDFFAVERYPRVEYVSRSIAWGDQPQIAHGVLRLKGKSRDLDVPFNLLRKVGYVVVSGVLTLNRLEYDIGTGEWSNTKWLGGEVRVKFAVALPGPS
ncbi:MAG: YceI family protein [Burkholderiales bacterium]